MDLPSLSDLDTLKKNAMLLKYKQNTNGKILKPEPLSILLSA